MKGSTGNAFLDLIDSFNEYRRRVEAITGMLADQLGEDGVPISDAKVEGIIDLLQVATEQAERRSEEVRRCTDRVLASQVSAIEPPASLLDGGIQIGIDAKHIEKLGQRIATITNSIAASAECLHAEGSIHAGSVYGAVGLIGMVLDEAGHGVPRAAICTE